MKIYLQSQTEYKLVTWLSSYAKQNCLELMVQQGWSLTLGSLSQRATKRQIYQLMKTEETISPMLESNISLTLAILATNQRQGKETGAECLITKDKG